MWKWQILLLLHSTADPVKYTTGNTKYLENPAHCFRETIGEVSRGIAGVWGSQRSQRSASPSPTAPGKP